MNNLKKIVAIATIVSSLLMIAGPTLALTAEELATQIAALQAQLAALTAQLTALQGTTPTVSGCTITSFAQNLKLGMSGDDVKCLQIILNSDSATQVATTGAGSPGSETTYFGSLTQAAVVKFQEKYAADCLTPLGLTTGTGFVGTKTRAKLNSLLAVTPPVACTTDANCATGYTCTAGTCVIKPVGVPMSVALTTDNPPTANVWRGSANNPVLKLTFVGGSTAINITGLKLTAFGTVEATGTVDVTAVKIYDENNIQVGADRTPAGNAVNFTIVPALVIPANGSRTITITANVGTLATVMANIAYGIVSASDITGANFSGVFPIKGNAFTIIPAGSIGSLAVAQYGSLPKTAVKIGEKDIVLEKFTLSAGSNEDVDLNQITVKNGATATCADYDLSNIRIRKTDGTVITGLATLSNKKVVFNLTSPLTITKGSSVNLEVIADIASGDTRTIRFWIDTGGIIGRGKNSGINLTSTGTTTESPVVIGKGTVTVSMSTSHPQGTLAAFVQTTNKKTLAVFNVRTLGEDVMFNTIYVKFNGTADLAAANYLSGVGLYDGDALVSDILTVNGETDAKGTFALNWTVPANTARDLSIKASTDSLGAADETLVSTFSYYSGYGMSSGEPVSSDTDITSTQITIYQSGKLTPIADTDKTAYNQGIVAPVNNITIGALKVYALREDLKLTDLVVSVTGTAYGDEAAGAAVDISNVTLYADDGITQLSNPMAPSNTTDGDTIDAFTFGTADLISDVIFTKGAYKTILVKANANASIAGTTAFYAYLADADAQFKVEGVDSGTPYDMHTDTAGLNFKFTTPFSGGAFGFYTAIAQIAKSADSPSGTITRGQYVTVASWDITNADSTGTDVTITGLTLTSSTGGLGALLDGTDEGLFRLYDEAGNVVRQGVAADTIAPTTGTITFAALDINGGNWVIPVQVPKKLVLRMDISSVTKFPSNTTMKWTILDESHVTVTGGRVGYGTAWSIPSVTNEIKLP